MVEFEGFEELRIGRLRVWIIHIKYIIVEGGKLVEMGNVREVEVEISLRRGRRAYWRGRRKYGTVK